MTSSAYQPEAARRIRRLAAHLAAPIGKRIGTGTVWSLDQLSDLAETIAASELEAEPGIRRLLRNAHDLPMNSDANWVGLLAGAIIEQVGVYGRRVREWEGFDAANPRTWPRRNRHG